MRTFNPLLCRRETMEAVLLDLDGLLLDSEQVYFRSFNTACAAYGMPTNDGKFFRFLGQNHTGTLKLLSAMLGSMERALEFEKRWSLEADELFQYPVPLKLGAQEFVAALNHHEVKRAIVTGNRESVAHIQLTKSDLIKHFDTIVSGDQVERGKPAPDIYLKAARTLGVQSKNCVAFEDSENGVRSALAAGMTVFQVPDLVQPSDEVKCLGHTVLNDLKEGISALNLM